MLFEAEDSFFKEAKIGDWHFRNDDRDLWLAFPAQSLYGEFGEPPYRDIVHLYIHKQGEADSRTPSWLWDGNRELPTISPSINVIGRWHGFLEAGKIKTV
jgi:hypothetical protein